MPPITTREIGLALDMRGCPNRCRHCWLGSHPNPRMTEDDLRWAADQFRSFVRDGDTGPLVEKLWVSSWVREPDFSDDYRRLAELEAKLGCGQPSRCELLSIRRLARDPSYAEWAKKIGPDTCQITFFGLKEVQDWFHRRPGAFEDSVTATQRLLDVGMKPRWQLFLTKKIIPDLAGLMKLVDDLRIRERVSALGGEFVMFMHPAGCEGEGRHIYGLSAELEDTAAVPAELVESTRKHFGREDLWTIESDVVSRAVREPDSRLGAPSYQNRLYFFVLGNWDVFSNLGTLDPWWKLGNLKTDSVASIIDAFERDIPVGLRVHKIVSLRDLAVRYGNPDSRFVVNGIDSYWREQYCAEQ